MMNLLRSVKNDSMVQVTSQISYSMLAYEDEGLHECVATESIFNTTNSSRAMLTVQGIEVLILEETKQIIVILSLCSSTFNYSSHFYNP